ncbi:MAG: hypothetical protein FWE48_00045 [Coriobacteriia bacterium]|nr:hypothetical protein [Coriobacteriia bacterium]MCL2745479.1 hypothetical protein [Coriobacteriia bacterium]MCL2871208.1 hypothetical protein [Coriobacteriia bacterium]
MSKKKIIKSIRLDPLLNKRIESYRVASGLKEADAIRHLLEQGLACESLNVFATPVGSLIRDVMEVEFNLLREEMQSRNDELEERIAKVNSKGTKSSLYSAVMLTDLARAVVPVWKETDPYELWRYYSQMAGELQSGRSYRDVKDG